MQYVYVWPPNAKFTSQQSWPRGYKAWVHSQTQNKAQWLAVCGHVSASSQSLRFILSLSLYSIFITSRPIFPHLFYLSLYFLSTYKFTEYIKSFSLPYVPTLLSNFLDRSMCDHIDYKLIWHMIQSTFHIIVYSIIGEELYKLTRLF